MIIRLAIARHPDCVGDALLPPSPLSPRLLWVEASCSTLCKVITMIIRMIIIMDDDLNYDDHNGFR